MTPTTPDDKPKRDPVRELFTTPVKRRSLSDILDVHRRDEPAEDVDGGR